MHLRPPAFSHGFTSFLWGLFMGLFIWLFLAGVGWGGGTGFLLGVVGGVAVFFFVLLLGSDRYRV
jgi:hypothetical protein